MIPKRHGKDGQYEVTVPSVMHLTLLPDRSGNVTARRETSSQPADHLT